MYGAILGDIVGSPFEFDRGDKTKDFEVSQKHFMICQQFYGQNARTG